ncbi:Protein of unknown function [Cotesia congregata]|uniref:Uncharacterized protein n=1 Tax=Cotesia congregata TaxID=51543 RepID=A0A8J2HCS5_COTCN|nr:Protein of unknown function [Cotesia congregata]
MDREIVVKKASRREGLGVDKHNLDDAIDKYCLAVCQAISNHQMGRNNSSFFEDKIINNAPIETIGPFAGYTALHIACMNGDEEFIRLLVEDYHENVNAVADDGAQPIHFACKANLKVKKQNNHTSLLIKEVHDHEWINARDSDGYTAAHYRLRKQKIENDPNFDNGSGVRRLLDDMNSGELIHELLDAGADVNATVNDDPTTLLLNMAARKHYPYTLDKFLAYHDNISKSMALHYSLCPLKSSQTRFGIIRQKASINLTLKDLIYRRTFGLFVPEDEKILMDKLIAEDKHFRELAHTYEQNVIQGELKTEVLK